MRLPTLSIQVASCGRPTLPNAIASATSQMLDGDELLLLVNEGRGDWGHSARNELLPRAAADVIMFLDDDDEFLPGALATVREVLPENPSRPHFFRVNYPDGVKIWRERGKLEEGEIGTGMMVLPNLQECLGRFDPSRYGGDFAMAASTVERMGEGIWREETLYNFRPA